MIPERCDGPADVQMTILLTAGHREMLRWLANRQRRKMNSVIRVAIERVYEAEKMAEQRAAAGLSSGRGGAMGRS